MTWDDSEYFRHRAEAERDLSAKAADPHSAAIHLELAERYESLVAEVRRPTLRLVTGQSRRGGGRNPIS